MRKRVWLGILVSWLAVGAAAQDVKTGEKLLRDALLKKELFPRNFSGETVMHWKWTGNSLAAQQPAFQILARLAVNSVQIKGSKVEIEGDRQIPVRQKDGTVAIFQDSEMVRVEVDLTGADLATVLPELPGLLFYPSAASALDGLPDRYRGMLPPKVGEVCCFPKPVPKTCDCANTTPECTRNGRPAGRVGAKLFSVKHSSEPEFSEKAREGRHSNWTVGIGLDIDETGHPKNLWIVRPVGIGLDENAAKAAAQYVFEPATCHGTPVSVPSYLEVKFENF